MERSKVGSIPKACDACRRRKLKVSRLNLACWLRAEKSISARESKSPLPWRPRTRDVFDASKRMSCAHTMTNFEREVLGLEGKPTAYLKKIISGLTI